MLASGGIAQEKGSQMIFPIWQVAILITMFFVFVSVWLQIISKKSHIADSKKFNELILNNHALISQIQQLQYDISMLNDELERLTIENRTLNSEIGLLTEKVSKLQSQVQEME